MTKIFKLSITIFLVISILFSCNYVFATSDDEDLADSEALETLSDDEDEEVTETVKENASDQSSMDTTFSQSTSTKVSNINSYEEANLQLNNILSIILISIGVLLILFAIAILIRIKSLS